MRFVLIALALGLALPCGAASTGTTEIDQVGQRFSRTSLSLPRGETVHFTNHDDVTHNISVIDAVENAVDKGLQRPGEEIAQLFDRAGKFVVRCSIHPKMKMVIVVN